MPKRAIFDDFSGGINNNSPPNQIEDNEVFDALNLIFDKTSNLKVRPGLTRINWNKNLLIRTEEFNNVYWSTTGVSISADTTIAPDSTTTADSLIGIGGVNTNFIYTDLLAVCNDDEIYTVSVYIKKDPSATSFEPALLIRFFGVSNIQEIISINLTNGSLTEVDTDSFVQDYGIEEYTNYYRIWITAKNGSIGNTDIRFGIFPNRSGSVDQTCVIWGAQLERGVLSDYHKNVNTAPTQTDNYLFNKITSLLDFQIDNGTNKLICTSGTDIYRLNNNNYLEKITGTLDLPNDTYWQWVIYDNVALGVNRATTPSGKDGIVKIEDHSSNAKGLDWNRNHLLYTEQFQQSITWKIIGTPVITINQEENPIDGVKNADYIKDDATNLLTRTQEFDHSDWVLVATPVVTTDTDIAPDGTETADTIEDDSGSNQEYIYQNTPVSDSEIYYGSVYIKKLSSSPSVYPVLRLRYTGGTGITVAITIDANAGTVQDVSSLAPDDKGIIDEGGYYRVWIKQQNNATGNNDLRLEIAPAAASIHGGPIDTSATGSSVFWGAQLEKDALTDYHAPSNEGIYQDIGVGDSETYIGSVYIRKTGVVSYYPVLKLEYLNGTSELECGVIVDTQNGALVDITGKAPDDKAIIDVGSNYWRVWIKKANNATKNDVARFSIFPAYASALTGSLDLFVTGQNTFWGAQLEEDYLSAYKSNVAASYVSEPPKGNYITVWNNRIWVIDADDPNTLVGSGLGDFEDWAKPGAAGSQRFSIGGEEGDICTGLGVHKDRLFVFKSSKIYYIQPGTPNTDIQQYEVKELSSRIGTVSGYSVQSLVDDMVFLSKYGIASLTAVDRFGDFENSIISQKISDLNKFEIDEVNSASVVDPSESQYWLAAPLQLGEIHSDTWVMDFTNLQTGNVGFTRFEGKIIGASYSLVKYSGRDRVYIGGYPINGDEKIAYIYRYGDSNTYNDDGSLYNIKIETKSHSPGSGINNSEFIRVFFLVDLITSSLSLSLLYKFNESSAKVKSWSQFFNADIYVGGLWDSGVWDEMFWGSTDTLERRIDKKVLGSPGRIARSIQFGLSNVSVDEAFTLKAFGFDFELFTHKKD